MHVTRTWALSILACSSPAIAQECAVPPAYCPPACQAPSEEPPPRTGRFVRGPAPGSTTGESKTYGVRGAVLHLPEIRIQLPHLELPSIYKIRHDAAKSYDSTRSPLVEDEEVLEFDNIQAAPRQPPPQAPPKAPCQPMAPYCPPACTAPQAQCTPSEETLKALQQQLVKLEQLELELAALRSQQAAQRPEVVIWKSGTSIAKPEGNISVGIAPKANRIATASYEEAAWAQQQPTLPSRRPIPNASQSDFGDWKQVSPPESPASDYLKVKLLDIFE